MSLRRRGTRLRLHTRGRTHTHTHTCGHTQAHTGTHTSPVSDFFPSDPGPFPLPPSSQRGSSSGTAAGSSGLWPCRSAVTSLPEATRPEAAAWSVSSGQGSGALLCPDRLWASLTRACRGCSPGPDCVTPRPCPAPHARNRPGSSASPTTRLPWVTWFTFTSAVTGFTWTLRSPLPRPPRSRLPPFVISSPFTR